MTKARRNAMTICRNRDDGSGARFGADLETGPDCRRRQLCRDTAVHTRQRRTRSFALLRGDRHRGPVAVSRPSPTSAARTPRCCCCRAKWGNGRSRASSLRDAVLGQAHKPSARAHIYWHRVQATADRYALAHSDVLGYAVAHELGHLLLPEHSHAPTGIMRAGFDPDNSLGLRFTELQGAQLRKRLKLPNQ